MKTEGSKFTSSAVLFDPNNITVGEQAIRANEPDRLERWFKKQMGEVQWRSKEHFGKSYSAVDLSGFVLKKLKQDAQLITTPITKAVITVPSYFEEQQRQATIDAANLAGLEVLSLINEPTAAALAYARNSNIRGRCLVYDFGGGTFDVSVVDINDMENIQVISSEGDNNLGGYNIDQDLAKLIDKEFLNAHGVSMLSSEASVPDRHSVSFASEQIKRQLSSRESVKNHPVVNLAGQSIIFSINRSTFNEVIRSRIRQTELLIETVLSDNGLKPADIQHVLLVGGSSRIPAVQSMLKRIFPSDPIRSINPDEAVAMGAAIAAAQVLARDGDISLPPEIANSLERTEIKDVSNSDYGTLALATHLGTDQLRNFIILPKNTPIPCTKTSTYYTEADNQTSVNIRITQGSEEDPRFVNTLFEELMELPPNRPSGQELLFTYHYDRNQMLHATVVDVASGRDLKASLSVAASAETVPHIAPSIFDDLIID